MYKDRDCLLDEDPNITSHTSKKDEKICQQLSDFLNQKTRDLFSFFSLTSELNERDSILTERGESLQAQIEQLTLEHTEATKAYQDLYAHITQLVDTHHKNYPTTPHWLSNSVPTSVLWVVPNALKSQANHASELSFIRSVLNRVMPLDECNIDETNTKALAASLEYKTNKINEAKHILLGGCCYIHQRIKEAYIDKKINSALYFLLEAILVDITPQDKMISLTCLQRCVEESFRHNETSCEEDWIQLFIILPVIKKTNLTESEEEFKKNIDHYRDGYKTIISPPGDELGKLHFS